MFISYISRFYIKNNKDFMDYIEALQNAEFFDYSNVRGCYVLRPNSYEIWENIRTFLDKHFKKFGIKNAYFPLFVTKKALEMEKDHISGFAPEIMYVSSKCKLTDDITDQPCDTVNDDNILAIRPTSEAIITEFFAKWLISHKQLPFKINQWCNVVRCEDKACTPFLRSVEILWHEGHTMHKTFEEATNFVLTMLDLYESLYQDQLAVPVIKGKKTELEKFAGGTITTTVEAFIPTTGKAIQAATSHNLGYSFANMFGVSYDAENMKKEVPCQTSFGLTTRSIGIMVLTHMDNLGVVLPPRIAPTQIIIIPIYNKKVNTSELMDYVNLIFDMLIDIKLRVEIDDRKDHTPGAKYNYYEKLGIPIRIEVGMNDLANKTFRIAKRYNLQKEDIHFDNFYRLPGILEEIQICMLNIAKNKLNEKFVTCDNFDDFELHISNSNIVATPWYESLESEEQIKTIMKKKGYNIKTLCKPFDLNNKNNYGKCFFSGESASCYVIWGKSY